MSAAIIRQHRSGGSRSGGRCGSCQLLLLWSVPSLPQCTGRHPLPAGRYVVCIKRSGQGVHAFGLTATPPRVCRLHADAVCSAGVLCLRSCCCCRNAMHPFMAQRDNILLHNMLDDTGCTAGSAQRCALDIEQGALHLAGVVARNPVFGRVLITGCFCSGLLSVLALLQHRLQCRMCLWRFYEGRDEACCAA